MGGGNYARLSEPGQSRSSAPSLTFENWTVVAAREPGIRGPACLRHRCPFLQHRPKSTSCKVSQIIDDWRLQTAQSYNEATLRHGGLLLQSSLSPAARAGSIAELRSPPTASHRRRARGFVIGSLWLKITTALTDPTWHLCGHRGPSQLSDLGNPSDYRRA